MTQVIIGAQQYDAAVSGKTRDPDWDYRASKSITLTMDHDTAIARLAKNTRVYAKKQLTWLKRRPEVHYLDPSKPLLPQALSLITHD